LLEEGLGLHPLFLKNAIYSGEDEKRGLVRERDMALDIPIYHTLVYIIYLIRRKIWVIRVRQHANLPTNYLTCGSLVVFRY
jgi:hypothetical protein